MALAIMCIRQKSPSARANYLVKESAMERNQNCVFYQNIKLILFFSVCRGVGICRLTLLLLVYALLFVRLAQIARASATNFDSFFTLGVLILFSAHLAMHIGINLGLLPVTGTTIAFMSSGGSHLVLEFALLGVVTSLARHGRGAVRDTQENEYLGG